MMSILHATTCTEKEQLVHTEVSKSCFASFAICWWLPLCADDGVCVTEGPSVKEVLVLAAFAVLTSLLLELPDSLSSDSLPVANFPNLPSPDISNTSRVRPIPSRMGSDRGCWSEGTSAAKHAGENEEVRH